MAPEASADDVTAWPVAVTSPDGALRWIETYDACDGVALHATFAGGDDVHDVALPVAALEAWIAVRGRDGAIRCFHNLCRHRGSRIVKDDRGH